MKQKLSPKIISLTFGILVICFAMGFYVYAVWTEPTADPPDGNVDAPLNVGSGTQSKAGALGIDGVFRAYSVAIVGTAAVEPIDPGEYELWVQGDLRVTGGFNWGSSMTYDADTDKLTVDAEIETDKFTVREVCLTGDICRTTWPAGAGGGCSDAIRTFSADSGSINASGCSSTLTIAGGTGIGTAIVGSTLTITNTSTLTEQDTLDTVSDRGNTTNQIISTAGLNLNGSAGEGNIRYINQLVGNNDIFIKGNSSETAPVYIGGSEIRLYTSSAERVRINSAGNLGIGTSSPVQKLHVVGNARITGLANCTGSSTVDADASGNLICGTDDSGASAQNLFLTINAPSGSDPVADSTTDTLNLSAGSGITVTGNSTTDTITIASTVASLWTDAGTYIRPNNYTNLAITDGGRLGIGTTSPTYTLDVVGNIGLSQYLYHNDDSNTRLEFTSDRIRAYVGSEYLLDLYAYGSQDYVKLGDGGDVDINLNNDVFVRGDDGYVGIGTESPFQKLHVVGNVRITGLVSCGSIETDGSGNLSCGTGGYSAGEGINISGDVISIKAPTASNKGGIRAANCPGGQAVTGIDTNGDIICSAVQSAGVWVGATGASSCNSVCSTSGGKISGFENGYTCKGGNDNKRGDNFYFRGTSGYGCGATGCYVCAGGERSGPYKVSACYCI